MKTTVLAPLAAALFIMICGCGGSDQASGETGSVNSAGQAQTETPAEKIVNVEFFTMRPTLFEDAITLPLVVLPR